MDYITNAFSDIPHLALHIRRNNPRWCISLLDGAQQMGTSESTLTTAGANRPETLKETRSAMLRIMHYFGATYQNANHIPKRVLVEFTINPKSLMFYTLTATNLRQEYIDNVESVLPLPNEIKADDNIALGEGRRRYSKIPGNQVKMMKSLSNVFNIPNFGTGILLRPRYNSGGNIFTILEVKENNE